VKPESWHFSFHGMVPYRPSLTPSQESGGMGLNKFYGHVFATWEAPTPVPGFFWRGEALVDLDANDDGEWLGGAGNASQLFRGDLGASSTVLRDINVGFEGSAFLNVAEFESHLPIGPIRLGRTSALYNGSRQAIWFKGLKGTGDNPWHGTLLSALEFGENDFMEGTLFADGTFFARSSSVYTLPGNAELTFQVTIENSGISAEVDGSVVWKATVPINGVDAQCKATGDLHAALAIGIEGGDLDFSGSLDVDGRVRCYVGNTRVASAGFDVGGEITEDALRFHLPIVGTVTLKLP
jgi:hypothetical protein